MKEILFKILLLRVDFYRRFQIVFSISSPFLSFFLSSQSKHSVRDEFSLQFNRFPSASLVSLTHYWYTETHFKELPACFPRVSGEIMILLGRTSESRKKQPSGTRGGCLRDYTCKQTREFCFASRRVSINHLWRARFCSQFFRFSSQFGVYRFETPFAAIVCKTRTATLDRGVF